MEDLTGIGIGSNKNSSTIDPITRYQSYELFDLIKVAILKAIPLSITSYIAGMITDRLGDRDVRTTNAMPYPPQITDNLQRKIKLMYKKAQFTVSNSLRLCHFLFLVYHVHLVEDLVSN